MSAVVPLFLIAPLFLVPFGLRLLAVATPGAEPPRLVRRAVLPAALLLTLSFMSEPGLTAAVLSLPWLAVTATVALAAALRLLEDPARFRPSVRNATDAAVAFLAVGATFATIDRLGARPFDFPSEIILLTAVHFHFAGFVLPLAGALAYSRRPRRWLEIALGAVVVGIPITALGFLGIPYANWVGAMLTAVGGFAIGVATVLIARHLVSRRARVLGTVAGASLLISMPMAVVYSTGTLVGATWLDLSTMARIHGGLNALGFAVPVVVAWTLATPRTPEIRTPSRIRPHVVGMVAAIVMAVYAIAFSLRTQADPDDFGPPEAFPRGLVFGLMLLVPAAVAAIGAIRRSRPTLAAAGALALLPALFLPGIVVPAVVLLWLGGTNRGTDAVAGRDLLAGVAIVLLGYAAWIVPNALTEARCWTATEGPNGSYVYAQAPITEDLQVSQGQVGSGCDSGVLTVQGVGVGLVLAIGAVAIAGLATAPVHRMRPA